MINGFKNSIKGHLVLKITQSPFTFYLTGSRYFGNCVAASDHDFFVQDSPKVQEWLKENNGRLIHDSDYNDEECAAVYRLVDMNLPCLNKQIDVQCVRNATLKNLAQQ